MGIDKAANILNILGYGKGGSALCPFKGHMFQKMGNADFIAPLITCTCLYPYPSETECEAGIATDAMVSPLAIWLV